MKNKSASRARGQRRSILHPTAISQAIAQLGQQWRVHHLRGMASALLAPGLLALSGLAQAQTLPVGGTVSAGAATISSNAAQMNVVQSSQRAVIDWTSFSIGQGAKVEFMVPNAQGATLNRVNGNMTSEIAGQLTSNGSLFLINPNGIAITPTGVVNTGGAFVASSLDHSNADFMAARMLFNGRGASARVSNAGSINAGQGAYVALLGGAVSNSGLISVPMGRLGLGSGEQVTLDINGNNFMQVAVPSNWLADNGALVSNSGTLQASGGVVQLKAAVLRQAVREVINMSGTINADSATRDGGRIELIGGADSANMGGMVRVSGRLSAQATGPSGNGGFIETSGAQLDLGGISVSTRSATGYAGHWLIDPYNITISSGAGSGTSFTGSTTSLTAGATTVINTTTLQTALAAGNVTITTGAAGSAGSDPGDITVASPLSWSSATTLTLTAARHININAVVNASGGTGAGFVGNTGPSGKLNFGVGGRIDLASTATFSLNGTSYTVITNLGSQGSTTGTDLQGMNGNLSRNYVLGANIDASATSSWSSNAGFNPIGTAATPFTGAFNGLGHVISGLTINRASTNNVGLFGATSAASSIRNVGLAGGSIAGRQEVGALVGTNAGTISDANSSASVTGNLSMVGGLVGKNTGSISNSYTQTTISISTGSVNTIGGLVGESTSSGAIDNSYAQGAINISTGGSYIGGLVGKNSSNISNSYADVAITATAANVHRIGGLAGTNEAGARISGSYATGNITANGTYSPGNGVIGGLVGVNYSGDAVSGGSSIINSYATGNVTATGANRVGGLVGFQEVAAGINPVINNSYSFGRVMGGGEVGGLVGLNQSPAGSSITSSYWNTTNNSASLLGVGVGSTTGVTGLSATAFRQAASFAGWSMDSSGGQAATWRIYEGSTAPLLKAFLTPMAINLGAVYTATYNGQAQSPLSNDPRILGSLTPGAINAGTYSISGNGLYSTQLGYDLSTTGSGGSLIITAAPITVTANAQSMTYGAALPTLSYSITRPGGATGLFGSDTLSGALTTAAGAAPNAGTHAITQGTLSGGGNYTLTYAGANLTVTPANLTLVGTRAYDGGTTVAGSVLTAMGVNGQTFTVLGSGAAGNLSSANAGASAQTLATVAGLSLGNSSNGGLANNYNALSVAGSAVTITPASLTLVGTRAYDGSTTVAGSVLTAMGVNGQSFTVTGAGAAGNLSSANAGASARTLSTVTGLSLGSSSNGGLASNYNALSVAGSAVTITAAPITVTANAQSVTYGAALPSLSYSITRPGGATGLYGSDTMSGALSSTAAGAAPNAGTYQITQGTLSGGGNYTLTYVGANLTVTPASLRLVGTRVYDGTTTVAGSVLTAMGVNGQTFTVLGAGAAGNLSSANAGASAQTLATAEGLRLGNSSNGGLASNYNALSVAGSAVTITAAPITVTANAQSMTYGNSLPLLTYSITRPGGATGLFGSDTLSGALSTAAGAAPNVGTYQITQGTLSGGVNYTLTYAGANLTVTPITLDSVSSFMPMLQSTSVHQPTGANLSSVPWYLRTANEKTWPDGPAITDQLRQSREVQWGPIASSHSAR